MNIVFASAVTPMFGVCLCIWGTGALADDVIPPHLLEKLSTNESLYRDLAVSVRLMREPGEDAKPPGRIESNRGFAFIPIVSGETITRHVSQSGMYRVDLETDIPTKEGVIRKFTHSKMFDGKTTRLLVDRRNTSVVDGYSDDDNFVRPHMLLLRRTYFYMPLSPLLSGSEQLHTSRQSPWSTDQAVRYVYDSAQEFRNLKCHAITVILSSRDSDEMRIELLLAEERNLVPARVKWYQLKVSSLEPVEESEVLEWTQVEPGIWFPRRATLVKYDPLALKRKGIKQISWTDEISTSDLSLKPQKDHSFFQE